ncbi:hypothetical protein WG66_009492 [Moniliophthora roreri]|nr:hypothetical protein WG66_009492 [Moniliophthora roreri]
MSVTEFVWWMDGHFYFWSFDKTGQSRMSREECERWGLPVLTVSAPYQVKKCNPLKLHSWSTHIYTTLRDWQKARGFDPTTSDWARDMGLPEVEILSDLGRFKESCIGSGSTPSFLMETGLLEHNIFPCDEAPWTWMSTTSAIGAFAFWLTGKYHLFWLHNGRRLQKHSVSYTDAANKQGLRGTTVHSVLHMAKRIQAYN